MNLDLTFELQYFLVHRWVELKLLIWKVISPFIHLPYTLYLHLAASLQITITLLEQFFLNLMSFPFNKFFSLTTSLNIWDDGNFILSFKMGAAMSEMWNSGPGYILGKLLITSSSASLTIGDSKIHFFQYPRHYLQHKIDIYIILNNTQKMSKIKGK